MEKTANSRYAEQMQETKKFFDILQLYTKTRIGLHLINHGGITKNSAFFRMIIADDLKPSEAFDALVKYNAWERSGDNWDNVYFTWSEHDFMLNIAFVDDIMGEYVDRFIEENNFMLIQTSQHKYQGLFLLDRYVGIRDMFLIQVALQMMYNGDPYSLRVKQLKRIPGFINTKYGDGFVVKIAHTGKSAINADYYIEFAQNNASISTLLLL